MPNENRVLLPRFAECQKIGCKYHRKEARYEVAFFPAERMVVVKCLECRPHMEICRFVVERDEAPEGEDHRLLKPRGFKVNSA